MPAGDPLSADAERALYLRGIELFNAGAFFEAHEAWEDAWRLAQGVKRKFYQGMIQCAVALEHFRRSNPRGVLSLHASYLRHFGGVPPTYMGLDVVAFLADMERALAPVLTADPPPARGEVALDPSAAPTIVLTSADRRRRAP